MTGGATGDRDAATATGGGHPGRAEQMRRQHQRESDRQGDRRPGRRNGTAATGTVTHPTSTPSARYASSAASLKQANSTLSSPGFLTSARTVATAMPVAAPSG